MDRTYLISTEFLKAHTIINNNVTDELLNNAIFEAQVIHIQQTIGTKLYEKLLNLVRTNDIHQPQYSDYKNLLDGYVMECTAYWALYECLPYIRYKVVNKGVSTQNSEWSNGVDSQELNRLQESIADKAQFFTRRLSDFILQNRNLYPEYIMNNKIDELHPNGGEYFSGFQFDSYGCPCERTMGLPKNTIDLI
jgi:hypothetical protein